MRDQSLVCAAALAAAFAAVPSAAQVVDFGKYPDFKGHWVRTANPNKWRELVGPPPLTPEYQPTTPESKSKTNPSISAPTAS
jgi:hypothetical protein